jgi:hypothetical protein
MPLLLILFALLVPRITLLVLWLFTGWFDGLFATVIWPILGFVFAPTALLWYSAVHHWFGGSWTLLPIIGIIVALIIDFAPAGGRRTARVA